MFEILGKLGVGGMADVFLANADIGGRVQAVALKRIRASMNDCADVWPMFQREAELCKLLNHPTIVQLKAVGDDSHGPYLALEYVAGATVGELIRVCTKRGAPMQLDHGLSICRDIADGIAYAHGLVHELGRGLVHRDISPENVLVGYDGWAKVTDFGIAWLVGHTRFTRTGAVRGKVGYLAPELVEGGVPSTASDVFALAATVFKVLTNNPAFKGNNDGELLRSLMFGPPPLIQAARGDVPAPIADWCDRAFRKDPAKRPTAAELVALIPQSSELRRKELGRWLTTVFPPRVFSQQPTGEKPPVAAPLDAGKVNAMLGAADQGPTVIVTQQEEPPETVPTALFDTLARALPRRVLALALLLLVALGVGAFFYFAQPQPQQPPPQDPPPAPVTLEEADPAPAAVTTTEDLPSLTETEAETLEADAPPEDAPTEPGPTGTRPVSRRVRRGLLDVRVTPFADVFIDGKLMGTTPLKPIELAPGTHKVMLINPALDAHKTVTVTVESGRKTRLTEILTPKKQGR